MSKIKEIEFMVSNYKYSYINSRYGKALTHQELMIKENLNLTRVLCLNGLEAKVLTNKHRDIVSVFMEVHPITSGGFVVQSWEDVQIRLIEVDKLFAEINKQMNVQILAPTFSMRLIKFSDKRCLGLQNKGIFPNNTTWLLKKKGIKWKLELA